MLHSCSSRNNILDNLYNSKKMNLEQIIEFIPTLDIADSVIIRNCVNDNIRAKKDKTEPEISIYFKLKYTPLVNYISECLGYDITSKNRKREYTFARYITVDYLLKEYRNMPSKLKGWVTIARMFKQDHATIIATVSVHQNEMKTGHPYYIDLYNRIHEIIEDYNNKLQKPT